MLSNSRTVRIEWGDCDPAGIIFYPRYFAMFDHSTGLLISKASGMGKAEMLKHYNFGGHPLVDTKARFIIPTRFGDDVVIESTITRVGRSSFDIRHHIMKDGKLAVEGNETRCWVVRDPSRPGGLRAQPMPDDVVAKFSAIAA